MPRTVRVLALALALVLAGGPLVGELIVRGSVLPKVARRLGRPLRVTGVRVGLGRVELRTVVLDGAGGPPPFVAESLRVRVELLPLFIGRVRVSEVELVHPRFDVVRGADGSDNLAGLREALARRDGGGGGGRLRVEAVRLVGARVNVIDDELGEAHIGALDGVVRADGPAELWLRDVAVDAAGAHASAAGVRISAELAGRHPVGPPRIEITGGTLTPFRGLSLTGIRGTVEPERNRRTERIAFHGSYGGATSELWNAAGWLDLVSLTGELTVKAERFRLSQLDSVLRNKDGSPELINAHDGEVDARLDLAFRGPDLSFAGGAHLSGLTVAHPMLAPVPVPRLGFDARLRGRVDFARRTLRLTEAAVDFRNLHARLSADVANLGRRPRFSATLQVQPVSCQTALAALPAELVPNLQGFQLAGTFSTDLHIGLDLADLESPVDLGGKVGIEGCRVTKAPEAVSAEHLAGTFQQTVEYEPGRWMSFFVGPESPEWTPFAELSPFLINSILTTEDSGFFKHHGFIPSEFRSALQQNLQRGYFRLGASSITMQTVKNVLLSREKTLSRKLQEMFLTWYLEHHLTKERIMEIYFNVIEFGPGIYGIGRAARHYFGKPPRDLEPQEAAWFSSILPNPKRRYVQYCHANGLPDVKWDAYVKRILRRTHERGRLSDEDYARAAATPLRFSRAEARPEKECLAYVKRITTPLGGPLTASASKD